ncbi:hypothetical protein [Prevotella intermedia]|uniref:hypothetical protein n=1 Tax=Prevotella intermedia TaxID=28131 RepID=UPI000C246F52|nr:hypothetical protein [Prevotella intermedia]PJI21442.1 hypothetical protein CTM45_11555 [Prevotella intermedia]
MIWILITLTFICLIGFIVIVRRYTGYYDRRKEIALYVLAISYLILELGILIYMVSNDKNPMVQYTCKMYHNGGKVDTIKVIKQTDIIDNTPGKFENFGDKTIYQCEVLKVDTIKE